METIMDWDPAGESERLDEALDELLEQIRGQVVMAKMLDGHDETRRRHRLAEHLAGIAWSAPPGASYASWERCHEALLRAGVRPRSTVATDLNLWELR